MENLHSVYCLWLCSLAITSTGQVGLCFLWFYDQEHMKSQLAVDLVLKHLRRRGHSLKSHPTDWEKSGIKPTTPGSQGINLSPTPRCKVGMDSIYDANSKLIFSCFRFLMFVFRSQKFAINVILTRI